MNYSSLDNQLFLLNAIAKTNKDFDKQYDDKKTDVLEKTKELLEELEKAEERLSVLEESKKLVG